MSDERPRRALTEGVLFCCYFCLQDCKGGEHGDGVLLQRRNGDMYPICRECWERTGKVKGWSLPTEEILKQRDRLEAALNSALKYWDRRIGNEAMCNKSEVDDWNLCVALTGYEWEARE